MKRMLLFAALLGSVVFAKSEIETCKKCHPAIVDEFETSMHKRSSYYDDKIHKAIWEKHPLHAKGEYKCAKCHTPNAKNEKEAHKGITCTTCHTIKDVQEHAVSNKNVYGEDKKTFYSAEAGRENEKVVYKQESTLFGLGKTTVGSPYHDIDYTNENFYTGKVCMGCHSHKQNSHEFELCRTEEQGAQEKEQNCITCHMPKVEGSATTIRQSQKHAFHGFAGARKHPEMLSKYVTLDLKKSAEGFEVIIENKAPHNLLLHPLRVVELRVNIVKNSKATPLKTHTFMKVIGNENGPSMPWVANRVLKDTMLKANEKKSITYNDKVQSGARIEVQLGYYVVNPKALKKLQLEGNEEIEKFTILQQKYFTLN